MQRKSLNEINSTITKLKWRCAKGHEWRATHSHIKNKFCY